MKTYTVRLGGELLVKGVNAADARKAIFASARTCLIMSINVDIMNGDATKVRLFVDDFDNLFTGPYKLEKVGGKAPIYFTVTEQCS